MFHFSGVFEARAKYKNFVGFLVQMKTLKFGSEINWPLGIYFHWIPFGLRTLSNRNQCQSQYFRITYMCRRPTKYVIHVHSNESFWCIVFSESTNLCCKSFRMKPKPYMVVISLFWSTHLFCWISWINRFVLQLFPNKATFRPNSIHVKSALPTYLDLNARIFSD